MDGQNIDADFSQDIAAIAEPALELFGITLDLFDQENGAAALDRLVRPLERVQLHACDVELDKINAGKVELIESHFANFGGIFRVVDRLADELVIGPLAKLQTAKARRDRVIRVG